MIDIHAPYTVIWTFSSDNRGFTTLLQIGRIMLKGCRKIINYGCRQPLKIFIYVFYKSTGED